MSVTAALATILANASRNTRWELIRLGAFCIGCQGFFDDGDVVYRRRRRDGLRSYCAECVAGWHPSWLEHARPIIPCAGECGVRVSHWYRDRYDQSAGEMVPYLTTCSQRCTERAAAARRRAVVPATCKSCGDTFTPARSDSRYCSNACRQHAYRARKALR